MTWCQAKRTRQLLDFKGGLKDRFAQAWDKANGALLPIANISSWKNGNIFGSEPEYLWTTLDAGSGWLISPEDHCYIDSLLKGLMLGCQVLTEAYVLCALEEAIEGEVCGFSGQLAYRSKGVSTYRLETMAKVKSLVTL